MSIIVQNQKPGKKGIYFGWRIVITSAFLMALIFTPLVALPGIFTIPVTEELNFSRTSFNMHMTICTLATMLTSLIVGKIIRKYNIKLLMTTAAVTLAACFLGYTLSVRLWQFYLISAVAGICGACLGVITISILINNWFGKRLKGKAIGAALAGSGIGAMIMNPLLSHINTVYGWRYSYYLLTVLIVVFVVPLILLTIVKTPQEKGLPIMGSDEENNIVSSVSDSTAAQACRSKLLFSTFITFLLFGLVGMVFNANGISYFASIGFNNIKAGTMMSIASAGTIVGKLLLGSACDKWGAKYTSMGAVICFLIGAALLISTSTVTALGALAAVFCGLGNAIGTVAVPLIVLELFGNRDYGSILGISNMAIALGSSGGPLLGALIFDNTGSYLYAWICIMVFLLIALITLHLSYNIKSQAEHKA